MMPRRPLALVAAIAGAISLAGCVPEPAPTPTPTGFASEEEAFAAAEETYRAYIEATNKRNSGEDSDPTAYLVGEALSADEDVRDLLEETQRSFQGEFKMLSFKPIEFQRVANAFSVSAIVCMDSTDVIVVDSNGTNVTPEDDVPIYALAVDFTTMDGEFRIAQSESSDQEC